MDSEYAGLLAEDITAWDPSLAFGDFSGIPFDYGTEQQSAHLSTLSTPEFGEEAATSGQSHDLSQLLSWDDTAGFRLPRGPFSQESQTTLPEHRGLVHQSSNSSLGSQYSRFGEAPLGRGHRLAGAYECQQCSATFDLPSDLRQHERKHIPKDELPHACTEPGCGERFLFPKDLRRHVERKHSKSVAIDTPVNSRMYVCAAPDCDVQYPDQQIMEAHMSTVHPTCVIPLVTPVQSTPQSPKPLSQDQGTRKSRRTAYNVIERRYRSTLIEKFDRLRQAIPGLGGVKPRASLVDRDCVPQQPSKATIIEGAVDHISKLNTDIWKLVVERSTLESRVEEFEKRRMELDLLSANLLSPADHYDTGLEASPRPQLRPERGDLEVAKSSASQTVSRKRPALDPLESGNTDSNQCDCLRCRTNIQCPIMRDLMRENLRLGMELKLAKRNAEIWAEERDTLAQLLHEVCGDSDLPGLRINSERSPTKSISITKRAKDWLVALRVLIWVKKKARGEQFESTAQALDQLAKDVEHLDLR